MEKIGRQQGSKFRQMTQLRQIWSHWAGRRLLPASNPGSLLLCRGPWTNLDRLGSLDWKLEAQSRDGPIRTLCWRRALAAAPLFVLCATVPACLAQGQSHRLHSTDSAASSAIIAPPISNMINRTFNFRMFSTLDYPQEKKSKKWRKGIDFLAI